MKKIYVFLFYILCAIVFTWPSILHLNDMVIGDGGDNYEYLSYQYLVAQNLSQGKTPFAYTNTFRYPDGFNFSLGSDAKLFSFVGGILNFLVNGVIAYNLTIYLVLVFNGYCSFLFFKTITKSNNLGLLGGLIYGFSFYVLAKGGGHPNLMQVYGFPLLGYFFLKVCHFDQKIKYHIFGLFFSFILIALSSFQYFCISLVLAIFFIPSFLLFYFNEIKKYFLSFKNRKLNYLYYLSSVLFFFLFNCLCFLFIFKEHIVSLFLDKRDIGYTYFFNPIFWFLPTQYSRTFTNYITETNLGGIGDVVFWGYLEIFLLTLAFIKNIGKKKKLFVFLIILIFIVIVLSLGSNFFSLRLPFFYLRNIYPFKAVIETQRFFVVYYLFIVSVILLFLKSADFDKNIKIILVLFSLTIIERGTNDYYLSSSLKKPYQKIVFQTQSKAVLDLPIMFDGDYPLLFNLIKDDGTIAIDGGGLFSEYNPLPAYYKKKIISGYFHWLAELPNASIFMTNKVRRPWLYCKLFSDTFDKLIFYKNSSRTFLQDLEKNEINTLVIHKKFFYEEGCYDFRLRYLLLLKDLSFDEAQVSERDYKTIKNFINNSSEKEKTNDIKSIRIYEDGDVIIYVLK